MVSISTRGGRSRADAGSRRGRLDAVELGHADVHQHDVGLEPLRLRRRPRRRRPPRRRPRCPGSASRIMRKPARTSAWSSAIRTRITAGSTRRERPVDARRPALGPARRARRRTARTRSRIPTSPWPAPLDPCAGLATVVDDLELEAGRLAANGRPDVGAGAGVLDRVGERLLHDAVRGEVDARRERRGVALDRRASPAARRRATARPAASSSRSVGCGRERGVRRPASQDAEQAAHLGQRLAAGVLDVGGGLDRAVRGSRSSIRRAPPACTTITVTECATTSCSSRAIRRRSSAARARDVALVRLLLPGRRPRAAPR